MQTAGMPFWMRLLVLFFAFFRIAALVVGGGLAMLPVIEETFVDKHKILTREELLDMVTLTQTMPGIVAVNSAIFVGTRVAGFPGAVCATFGAVLPSFLVILVVAACFPHLDTENRILLGALNGVRSCVAAMIFATAIRMARRSLKNWFELSAMLFVLILALCGVSPAFLILGAMPAGCLYVWFQRRRTKA